jgi:hypothetical protein
MTRKSHLPRTIVVRIVRTLSATFHYIDSDASSTTTPYSFERMPGCILVDHPWSTMPAHHRPPALNLATPEYSRCHCRVEPTTNVADQRPRRADLLNGATEATSQLRKCRILFVRHLKQCRARSNLQKRSRAPFMKAIFMLGTTQTRGSNFNDGTTQTARDLPLWAAGSHP